MIQCLFVRSAVGVAVIIVTFKPNVINCARSCGGGDATLAPVVACLASAYWLQQFAERIQTHRENAPHVVNSTRY